MQTNQSDIKAKSSFYDLEMKQNNGQSIKFDALKGKKVMIVNTASACGFTPQYDGLQHLHEKYNDSLVILGFPANDFGAQEQGDDHSIEEFCKVNFGVTFPLMAKSTVVKDESQNKVYQWLTDKEKNGWNSQAPTWNFCKYIVDENGNLTHFFEAGVEPDDTKILEAIQ